MAIALTFAPMLDCHVRPHTVNEKDDVPTPVFEDERTDALSITLPPGREIALSRIECFTITLLTGSQAGLVHILGTEETVLGRGHGCSLRIEDGALSRRHCRILKREGIHYVEDLGSTNGTFAAGERVMGARALEHEMRLRLGNETILAFSKTDLREAEAARSLYESAMNDPLTGVRNRRYLEQHLRSELAYALRHGTTLSLLLLDADHFKRINDKWGHPAGDSVLRALGGQLQRSVRTEDMVARFGGEEFVILARGIPVEGALALAERIRKAVERMPVRLPAAEINVTVSLGVVTMGPGRPFTTAEALLAASDEALYRAKQAGRNRSERG